MKGSLIKSNMEATYASKLNLHKLIYYVTSSLPHATR